MRLPTEVKMMPAMEEKNEDGESRTCNTMPDA
jgi:hypothetical protein